MTLAFRNTPAAVLVLATTVLLAPGLGAQPATFAVGDRVADGNIGALPGLLADCGVPFGGQALICHNITEMHHGERAGLLLQLGAQQLEAVGREFGLGGITQQKNGVGRGRGLGSQRPRREAQRAQHGKEKIAHRESICL